jgi:hypothetical protein
VLLFLGRRSRPTLALIRMFAFIPPEVVFLFVVLPFAIGGIAAAAGRRWGWPAIAIAVAVLLVPAAVSLSIAPSASGAKLAGILTLVVSIPSFFGFFLAMVVQKCLAREPNER